MTHRLPVGFGCTKTASSMPSVGIWRTRNFVFVLLMTCVLSAELPHCQDALSLIGEQNQGDRNLAGKVIDTNGEPIKDAIVVAQVLEVGVGLSYADTRSRADGRFELDYPKSILPRVERKDAFLWIGSPRHELRCVRPDLAPKGKLSLEITLQPARPIPVNVSGAKGDTLIEPYVVNVPNGVFESDRNTGLRMIIPDLLRSVFSKKLDHKGDAEFNGLLLDHNDKLKVVTGDGLEFVFSAAMNGRVALRIPETGIVRGSIKNLAGSKLEKVWLSSSTIGCETSRTCEVGPNGEFIARGMVPGRVSVSLKWSPKDPWQPEPFEYPTAVANATREFEISLVRGTPLVGQLLTEDTRAPIKSAKIELTCSYEAGKTGVSYYLDTDDEGRFSASLAPGEWTLQVYDTGIWAERYEFPPFEKFSVRLEESKVDLGVIELSAMPTETGEVVDEDGNPVANRWVAYITPELGHATRSAKTDSEGKFTTRVFGVQRPDSSPHWVIYPIGETNRSVDARTLPTLKVEKSKPWRLLLED